jgi:hypothetical protein
MWQYNACVTYFLDLSVIQYSKIEQNVVFPGADVANGMRFVICLVYSPYS